MRVLMVCLGNICRSPMAEGILQHQIKNLNWTVDSCGTSAYHIGKKADVRSIQKCTEKGIDINNLRARQFNTNDFDIFDFIFVMDKSNYADIISLTKNSTEQAKVKLMLDYSDGKETEVPDPYYGSNDGFELVYQLLNKAIKNFINEQQG